MSCHWGIPTRTNGPASAHLSRALLPAAGAPLKFGKLTQAFIDVLAVCAALVRVIAAAISIAALFILIILFAITDFG